MQNVINIEEAIKVSKEPLEAFFATLNMNVAADNTSE
jgi:hypothetical protein